MSDQILDYTWPADFPEGIPLDLGVVPAEGKVYRLVRTIPPTEVDFLRHRDEKPKYPYTKEEIPLSYGLSVWSKLDKLRRIEKNYPAPDQLGNWKTACGNLCHQLGVIPKEIKNDGHITLWVQEGQEPHNHFLQEVKK
ncbi:TPA: hypothetical protein ACGVAU_000636 [Vibrio vulnificus]